MKNFTACLIASVICRLLGIAVILAFVYFMVYLTNNLSCLWLLLLLLTVGFIPVYEIKPGNSNNKGDYDKND